MTLLVPRREIVTEWFRTPKVWQQLADVVLPRLRLQQRPLAFWSAGCGSGEEALSLAMLADEYLPEVAVIVLATELDPALVQRAELGRYPAVDLAAGLMGAGLTHRAADFARVTGPGEVEVTDRVRARVRWACADLCASVPERVDLVLARNVWRHLSDDEQRATLRTVHANLDPDGRLVLGGADLLRSRDERVAPATADDLEPWAPAGLTEHFAEAEHELIFAPC